MGGRDAGAAWADDPAVDCRSTNQGAGQHESAYCSEEDLCADFGLPAARTPGDMATSRLHLVDYDPSWPTRFREEAERLGKAFGSLAMRIDHVGSTAVSGLAETSHRCSDFGRKPPTASDLRSTDAGSRLYVYLRCEHRLDLSILCETWAVAPLPTTFICAASSPNRSATT